MLLRIARKEALELVRDGRFRTGALAVLGLLVAAVALGGSRAAAVARDHAAAQAATREHWVSQPAKNPHSAAHYGIYAFKPVNALAFADDGVDPYVGVATWLEAHKQNEFQFRPAADGTALQRFGNLGVAVILQLLVPLLIILLGFGAFAGEREAGTLRQLLAHGVPTGVLARGKALGTAAALGVVLVPAAALGGLGLAFSGGGSGLGGRAVTLGLVYVAYFAIWVALTLAVSAATRTARTALLVLLAVWMVNGLLAPRAATDLVRRLHPTPSQFQFTAAVKHDLEQGADGHSPADVRMKAFEAQVLKQYGVDSVSQLPVSFAGLSLNKGEEDGNRVYDKHFGALWQTYRRQEATREWLGLLAPGLAIRALSMGLAGTDVQHHERFTTAAEQYRRMLVTRMNDDITRNAGAAGFDYKADTTLWAAAPAFSYDSPALAETLDAHRPATAVLGGWTVLALVALAVALRRVRP